MASKIIPLDKADIVPATAVMAGAYHDNPLLNYFIGEYAVPSLLRWFIGTGIRYGLLYGKVYTTPEIRGVAVWYPPYHSGVSLWGMIRSGMISIPFRLGRASFKRLTGYLDYTARIHKKTAPGPHWYLCELGVDPSWQNKGIGGALIEHGLAQADSDDLPCYLETCTERALRFYEKYGFVVVQKCDVPTGGPCFWSMVREPLRKK